LGRQQFNPQQSLLGRQSQSLNHSDPQHSVGKTTFVLEFIKTSTFIVGKTSFESMVNPQHLVGKTIQAQSGKVKIDLDRFNPQHSVEKTTANGMIQYQSVSRQC
jgi:hypothetical protein